MSTEPNPQPQESSESTSLQSAESTPNATSSETSPKKSRSPVERIIVWGLILALAAVAGFEGWARYGHYRTLNALSEAIKQQEGPEDELLTIAGFEKLITGHPSRSEPTPHGLYQQVVYTWSGLFKKHTIVLTYEGVKDALDEQSPDYSPLVLSYETNTESSDHHEILASQTGESEGAEDGDGGEVSAGLPGGSGGEATEVSSSGGGESGGERSGGRRRFSFEQFDQDGDGKITEDEAPERMKQNFGEIDANGDGGIDAEEFAAIRRRRSERSETPRENSDSNESPAATDDPPRESPAASESEEPASEAPEASTSAASSPEAEPDPPPLPE